MSSGTSTCHKLGQGNHVCSLHGLSKCVRVCERQGRTKAFPNFLCIWINKEQMFFILYLPQVAASTKPLSYGTPFYAPSTTSSCVLPHRNQGQSFPQLNIADITQIAFVFVQHTLEMQVSYLYVGPNFTVGKEFFNESEPHIILHLFYTQHCVKKTWRGGARACWLIGPLIVNLTPTCCINCSAINLAI